MRRIVYRAGWSMAALWWPLTVQLWCLGAFGDFLSAALLFALDGSFMWGLAAILMEWVLVRRPNR